jgi:uncharacterized membrane protein YdbT with pleckstrin-like domain
MERRRQRNRGERAEPVIVLRHHPLLLVGKAWRPGLLMLVAAVAAVALATRPEAAAWAGYGLALRLLLVVFLAGGLWAAALYVRWSANLLYLTDERLVEIAGVPHISEERRELRIDRVQSVELARTNALMTWVGCADIAVAIAGARPVYFEAARDAAIVRDRIMAHLRDAAAARARVEQAAIESSVEHIVDDEPPPLPANETPPPRQAANARRRQFRLWFGRQFAGLVWRRHPWFLVRAALGPVLLGTVALALPFLLDGLGLAPAATETGGPTVVLLVAALGWLAWCWADWRNDHYIVTSDRIIEIEQWPLGLRQQISETALDRVQDMQYRVPNPLAHLLNYGDVMVHTASGATPFVFRGIARPRELVARIDEHVTAFRLAEEYARHQALRQEFAQWLRAYEVASESGGRAVGQSGSALDQH